MSNFEFRKNAPKVMDRFRALFLAHTEQADNTFTVLCTDLLTELRESNTNVNQFLTTINAVTAKIQKQAGLVSQVNTYLTS
jgi:hypothetical protein